MSEHTHRYGDHEHTSVLPPYQEGPAAPAPPPRRRRRATAGLLAAALVLGGAGGVAGAAGYDALDDDAGSSTAQTRAPLNTARSASDEGVDEGSDTPPPDGSPEAVAASVLPSVVKINVAGPEGGRGSGSGIILSQDGEILTNNHVVESAEQGGRLTVNFDDGSGAEAEIVGTDPMTDLAVIKAQGVDGLTPATIGDSDRIDVGEAVVAIGSPFGLEATVTSGIVSAVNRPVSVPNEDAPEQEQQPGLPDEPQVAQVQSTTYPAIQTDAAINPGNSGGPLVDLEGQVIGINSSIRSASSGLSGQAGSIGLGFAIPITKVLPIVEQLRAGETATHARLGVSVSTSGLQDGLITGAGIETVEEGSAAAEAGVEEGDVVTHVDDEPIAGSDSLVAVIRGYRPGDEVTLTIVREGESQEVDVTLDSDLESNDS
jgi:putative serine protease PepD